MTWFGGEANLVGEARLLAVIVAVGVTTGCVQGLDDLGLPDVAREDPALEQIPGMGSVDLEDARRVFHLHDCTRTQLIADGHRPALAPALPEGFELAAEDGEDPRLIVTVTSCQRIETGNRSFPQAQLVTVGTPIATEETSSRRDDGLLVVGAPNTTLAAYLATAGAPAEPIGTVDNVQQQDHGMAERRTLDVDALSHGFEAHLTSVSIGADIPFGVGPAIGHTGWLVGGNDTLIVREGLEVDEVGGLSATLELPAGDALAKWTGNRSTPAHGIETRFDARLGFVPADAEPGSAP